MLLGTATFKCKQCGHKFPWLDIEGDFVAGEHLPHCPKCRSGNTMKKKTFIDKILFNKQENIITDGLI